MAITMSWRHAVLASLFFGNAAYAAPQQRAGADVVEQLQSLFEGLLGTNLDLNIPVATATASVTATETAADAVVTETADAVVETGDVVTDIATDTAAATETAATELTVTESVDTATVTDTAAVTDTATAEVTDTASVTETATETASETATVTAPPAVDRGKGKNDGKGKGKANGRVNLQDLLRLIGGNGKNNNNLNLGDIDDLDDILELLIGQQGKGKGNAGLNQLLNLIQGKGKGNGNLNLNDLLNLIGGQGKGKGNGAAAPVIVGAERVGKGNAAAPVAGAERVAKGKGKGNAVIDIDTDNDTDNDLTDDEGPRVVRVPVVNRRRMQNGKRARRIEEATKNRQVSTTRTWAEVAGGGTTAPPLRKHYVPKKAFRELTIAIPGDNQQLSGRSLGEIVCGINNVTPNQQGAVAAKKLPRSGDLVITFEEDKWQWYADQANESWVTL
ncbi:hypothetical protein QBC35DRAFT_454292, partial [Podospora australis]